MSPLQRIQFPWRWLSPTWMGALLWWASVGVQPNARLSASTWRRAALLTALAAVGAWFDSLWRFRTTSSDTPSRQEIKRIGRCWPVTLWFLVQRVRRCQSLETQQTICGNGDGRRPLWVPTTAPPHSEARGINTGHLAAQLASGNWSSFSGTGSRNDVQITEGAAVAGGSRNAVETDAVVGSTLACAGQTV